ncbi:MAG: twin-arginine translocation signal domain-containing protein, partial [Burkholderiales bacterium]|nr:twin-arginine translocation signal domain-containing protein [Burkholderiales bacterium]
MTSSEQPAGTHSRRDFLKLAGMGAMAMGLGAGRALANDGARPYNILFFLTDQERFFRPGELPVGFELPAHERLMASGTTFVNHRINSCVCTPSRSVLYTGRHIQQTR